MGKVPISSYSKLSASEWLALWPPELSQKEKGHCPYISRVSIGSSFTARAAIGGGPNVYWRLDCERQLGLGWRQAGVGVGGGVPVLVAVYVHPLATQLL